MNAPSCPGGWWRTVGGGLAKLEDRGFPAALRSSDSGSCRSSDAPGAWGSSGGLETGETRGEVCRLMGMFSVVSKTKKASPPSPSFIE